jgi:DNA (cytosine-5)-methyltransferase 1
MSADPIEQKLARLGAGGKPRVLDLFAGCGGISLGFQAAGFTSTAAVEFDPDAARSHGLNFHGGESRYSVARDIIKTHPEDLASELDLGPVDLAVDVIVGGPPCQAFARVGRPKLREIDAHPQAFVHDPRARLYQEYLRYVDAFQPLAVLVENVPDVLNHGGQNIAEEICEVLHTKGYICGYTLLNAAFYGVPQMRERMFLIAYHRELEAKVEFPSPSNWLVLAPAVTAKEALGDLPPIFARQELAAGKLVRGARRLKDCMPYDRRRKLSSYGHLMRTWTGFEAPERGLSDHVIRYLPRDYELFARMNPGDQYPQAWQHAMELLSERVGRLRQQGSRLPEGSAEYELLRGAIVPPYDASKFPNKWRKMWSNQPARTLMAHLGKDSYSHIHYDSEQARTISVREAARLQSFPDGFVFSGTMNPAFRQIGNAVPPLMARALAEKIMAALRGSARQEDHVGRRASAAV